MTEYVEINAFGTLGVAGSYQFLLAKALPFLQSVG